MTNETPKSGNAGASGTETVTVACKLPHGLELRVFDMIEVDEPVQGGYRRVKRAQVKGSSVKIKGYTEPYRADQPPNARGSAYALTYNVPKDFWDLWIAQNADHDAVKNNLIFAHTQTGRVESKTKEFENLRVGLEPLVQGRMGNIEPARA